MQPRSFKPFEDTDDHSCLSSNDDHQERKYTTLSRDVSVCLCASLLCLRRNFDLPGNKQRGLHVVLNMTLKLCRGWHAKQTAAREGICKNYIIRRYLHMSVLYSKWRAIDDRSAVGGC